MAQPGLQTQKRGLAGVDARRGQDGQDAQGRYLLDRRLFVQDSEDAGKKAFEDIARRRISIDSQSLPNINKRCTFGVRNMSEWNGKRIGKKEDVGKGSRERERARFEARRLCGLICF